VFLVVTTVGATALVVIGATTAIVVATQEKIASMPGMTVFATELQSLLFLSLPAS
jgi:hypothetical protein